MKESTINQIVEEEVNEVDARIDYQISKIQRRIAALTEAGVILERERSARKEAVAKETRQRLQRGIRVGVVDKTITVPAGNLEVKPGLIGRLFGRGGK